MRRTKPTRILTSKTKTPPELAFESSPSTPINFTLNRRNSSRVTQTETNILAETITKLRKIQAVLSVVNEDRKLLGDCLDAIITLCDPKLTNSVDELRKTIMFIIAETHKGSKENMHNEYMKKYYTEVMQEVAEQAKKSGF